MDILKKIQHYPPMIVFEDSPISYLSEIGKGLGFQYNQGEGH